MKKILYAPLLLIVLAASASAQHRGNDIIGRWMSQENNLEVEVFKTGNEYKARVVWFRDCDVNTRPINVISDRKNPNEALRTRKIIGMEVMHGLVYNADDNEWQNGRVYDATSGKDWNVKVWLTEKQILKVRGFWHFQFLGQNMLFKKVS